MRMNSVMRSILGAVFSLGLACLIWEIFARSGLFAAALTPSLVAIGSALGQMTLNGSMLLHTLYTLYRVLTGFLLACAAGVLIGILMGRVRRVERFFVPLVSVFMPIPSLAWVPVFILWFGLGNAATIALVFYATTFPVIYNTWTGVRSINRLWIRSAEAMGADAYHVTRPGELCEVMPKSLASGKPTVINAEIDREEIPPILSRLKSLDKFFNQTLIKVK